MATFKEQLEVNITSSADKSNTSSSSTRGVSNLALIFPTFEILSISIKPNVPVKDAKRQHLKSNTVAETVTVVGTNENSRWKKRGDIVDKEFGKQNPNDHWGNSTIKVPEPSNGKTAGLTLKQISRRVKIPPLPARYNVYKEQPFHQTPVPVLSKDEKCAIVRRNLKKTIIFKGERVAIPKKLPARVRLLEVTNKGTVVVQFNDDANQQKYSQLQHLIEIWFGQQKFYEWNTKIDKDDVIMGRIVLAMVADRVLIRAEIVGYKENFIKVKGVDEPYELWLSYDFIYYYHENFSSYPYLILECHVAELKWAEGSFLFKQYLHFWLMKALKLKLEGCTDDSLRDKHSKDNININPNVNFILKKIKKNCDKYSVVLNFPEEVGKDLCLNTFIDEIVDDLLRPKEYMYTP